MNLLQNLIETLSLLENADEQQVCETVKTLTHKVAFLNPTTGIPGSNPEEHAAKGLNVHITIQKFTDTVNINTGTGTTPDEATQVLDILGEYFIRMMQAAEMVQNN